MNRFTSLVVAIVAITLFAMGSVVAISLSGAELSTATLTTILGFCATITASMLALLRVEFNGQEIRATREVVDRKLDETHSTVREIERKVNGNLETAIDKAVQSERNQLIAGTAMPKTTEELENLMENVVRRVLAQLKLTPPMSDANALAGEISSTAAQPWTPAGAVAPDQID